MKIKKIIIITAAIIVVTAAVFRLVSNKRISAEQLKMATEFISTIPVTVDTVRAGQVMSEFRENGIFIASREMTILSETQGKIVSIEAGPGERIRAGQVLVTTENEPLKVQYEMAGYNLEKAEKDLRRFEELTKADAATAMQYESSRQNYLNARSAWASAKTQLDNSYIKAPFDGIIVKKLIEQGTYLFPGTPVFELIDISKIKLRLRFTSEETQYIRINEVVDIYAETFHGEKFRGVITTIEEKADLSKRFTVEIVVPNKNGDEIKPGMFGSAVFPVHAGGQVLIIARRSLAGSIQNPEIFLVQGDSVVLKSIEITPFDAKHVVADHGLKEGDVIVTSGQINLVNGSKISLTE